MSGEPVDLVEIEQALDTLGVIARVRDGGRAAFDVSEERQWGAAYLWIAVGSALKQFCRLRGIDQGSSLFPGPIGMRDRLFYMPPRRLATAVLWETYENDADDLVSVLLDLRAVLQAK